MWLVVALACVVLIAWMLIDAFETIVMPRRVTHAWRFTRFFYRNSWRPWRAIAERLPARRLRNSMLALFGPLSILALVAMWVLGLVGGFALLNWALDESLTIDHPPRLFDYFYHSAVTFFTLGYGDVTPTDRSGRLLAMIEAGLGFGFLALIISYLPVPSQAFSAREVQINLLDARAGSPPTAGQLLLRLSQRDDLESLESFLRDWEVWGASLLESHLSFPVLSFYRSQHDNQSWLAALVTMLDTCALLISGSSQCCVYQAQLTFAMGRHVLVDLALVFKAAPQTPEATRFTDEALARLRAGLRGSVLELAEGPAVDAKLRELRDMYEPFAVALANYVAMGMPRLLPADTHVDNWQTSAWTRRTVDFRKLALRDADNEHFH